MTAEPAASTEESLSLSWGSHPSSDFFKALKDLEVHIEKDQSLLEKSEAPKEIRLAGLLEADPLKEKSLRHIKNLFSLLKVSMCAHWSKPPQADQCRKSAVIFVHKWIDAYQPHGHPIDETNLMPLLLSMDLVFKEIPEQPKKWLQSLAHQLESFHSQIPSQSQTLFNNWNSHRLLILGVIHQLLQNTKALVKLKYELFLHLQKNLRSPPGWKPRTDCNNNISEYGSLDFQLRDSFHYHFYNLQALVTLSLSLFVPQIWTDEEQQWMQSALDFSRPYVLGEKKHKEFVCTTVEFDQQRGDSGEQKYQKKFWNPMADLSTLRLFRLQFKDIKSWTEPLISGSQSSSFEEIIFTRFGDHL